MTCQISDMDFQKAGGGTHCTLFPLSYTLTSFNACIKETVAFDEVPSIMLVVRGSFQAWSQNTELKRKEDSQNSNILYKEKCKVI